MLVYGDHRQRADPHERAREINRLLDAVETQASKAARHDTLVRALIETGQLLQGIADAEFERRDCDCLTKTIASVSLVLAALGRAVCRSWDGLTDAAPLPRLEPSRDWPAQVDLKLPEGFAFYAVYPEAYVEAARRLKLAAPPRVIGIRSIGTSLAAVVAGALGAPAPTTVRPFGDPYDRKIAFHEALERELLDGDAHYVIVDEGPGQSGSSFAAVAEWLQSRGVASDRMALIPSHAGSPGPATTEARRCWWDGSQREVADFGDSLQAIVGGWCEELLGPLDGPLEDISGGRWRRLHDWRGEDWPAAIPPFERRKFITRVRGERFLVKFAGLGRIGEEKLAIGRTLFAEGLVPEPVGLAHGFIVERWCEHAHPLHDDDTPVAEIGRYIGTRARLLPAMSGSGASVDDLIAMVRRNVAVEFGAASLPLLDDWARGAAKLERRVVRVRTDNKLDRHEWLRAGSGVLIKTDALDHHQAHDLIGCQDLAWDVAGALVEFGLDAVHGDRLLASVAESSARDVDEHLLDFYRPAYLAFRLGQARLGEDMTGEARERSRIRGLGDLYAAELERLLGNGCRNDRHSIGFSRPRNALEGEQRRRQSVDEEDAKSLI